MTGEELYGAASKGDATKFQQLLQQDPYLVERVSFPCSRNLLHVATLRGQVAIVEEVLKISPQLALDLDSKNSSPLHIAAAKGNVEIVNRLLLVAPEMCWCRNSQGLNPVHIAAMKGDVEMLEVLLGPERAHREEVLKMSPQLAVDLDSQKLSPLHIAAAQGNVEIAAKLLSVAPEMCCSHDDQGMNPVHVAAMKGNVKIALILLRVEPQMCWCRDDQGLNPIHVSAMKGHVEMLEVLLGEDPLPAMERVHRGQTVLHLCVKHGQLRALKFLVDKLGDPVYAKDDDGETLLHCAVRSKQVEMVKYLVKSNIVEKRSTNSMGRTAVDILEASRDEMMAKAVGSIISPSIRYWSNPKLIEYLSKKREQTMVVMALIATMAFQAAVSPPGGVWQEDTSSHRAGEAVMASTHPKIYKHLIRANTTAFVSSLITIFLVAGPHRTGPGFLFVFTTYVMWVSLASIAVSYEGSVLVIAPNTQTRSLTPIINVVVAVSLSFFGIRLLWKILMRYSSRLFGFWFVDDTQRKLRIWVFSTLNSIFCGLLTASPDP